MRAALQDRIAKSFFSLIAISVLVMLLIFLFLLIQNSLPALKSMGIHFITSTDWNPNEQNFGALAFIYGTFVTSILALLVATPVSVCMGIFLSEICPKKLKTLFSLFVEMIASIPSLIFGLWGIFYLAPWVRDTISPLLKILFGYLPFFQGPSAGIGILSTTLVLSIMIIPTITSLCREVFSCIPRHQREAALALGSTRFEMISLAVIGPSKAGIIGAAALGLGRALGETMACAMLIGNSSTFNLSLFAPGATMASVIANEYSEASSGLHQASLTSLALILFLLTLIFNISARLVIRRLGHKG